MAHVLRCIAAGLRPFLVRAGRGKHDGDVSEFRIGLGVGFIDEDRQTLAKHRSALLVAAAAKDAATGNQCGCRQNKYYALHSVAPASPAARSEEHTSELQSLMRISYAVFCLK